MKLIKQIVEKINNNDYKISPLKYNREKIDNNFKLSKILNYIIGYYYDIQFKQDNYLKNNLQFIILPNNLDIKFKDLDDFFNHLQYIKYEIKDIKLKLNFNNLFNMNNSDSDIEIEERKEDEDEIELNETSLRKLKKIELINLCNKKGIKSELKSLNKNDYIDALLGIKLLRQKKVRKVKKETEITDLDCMELEFKLSYKLQKMVNLLSIKQYNKTKEYINNLFNKYINFDLSKLNNNSKIMDHNNITVTKENYKNYKQMYNNLKN